MKILKKYNEAKNQHQELLKLIKKDNIKIEKTTENIYLMSKKNGIKPTARYFNISPASVRYHIEKYENNR